MSRIICYFNSMECIFCEIASGRTKAEILGENRTCIAIKDIFPKAKEHCLIIPKNHIAESAHSKESDKVILDAFDLIRSTAKKLEIDETGYRIVTNHREHAGQTVDHLHFHVLGGEKLKEM